MKFTSFGEPPKRAKTEDEIYLIARLSDNESEDEIYLIARLSDNESEDEIYLIARSLPSSSPTEPRNNGAKVKMKTKFSSPSLSLG